MKTTVHKFRNDGWRKDTHLEYTLWFKNASAGSSWINGSVEFALYTEAVDQIEHVVRAQTPFVRENWYRLEIMVPNRDTYGNIRPGWVKDTGVLLATREQEIQE